MLEFIIGAVVAKVFGGSSKKGKKSRGDDATLDLAALEPGKRVTVRYDFKSKASVRLVVRSSDLVDVYFVKDDEVVNFDKNESFMSLSTSENVLSMEDEFTIPSGDYTLLIVNKSKKTVAVSYGLWSSG